MGANLLCSTHIEKTYMVRAAMQGKRVQRRDKGSSANIYPALTDEVTSSLWPRWESASSDLFLGNTGSTILRHHSTLSAQLHDGKLER
uniref:Uncharacterized protein n=1 Tax=Candidatus Kentrum sp. TC TaxID=2126339 RepID=A0A451A2C8_9GAMM|nr:MAG: hypothetical protein BECKTC1821F_GA0114240_10426 [Candidatus Kentron sp. TC]